MTQPDSQMDSGTTASVGRESPGTKVPQTPSGALSTQSAPTRWKIDGSETPLAPSPVKVACITAHSPLHSTESTDASVISESCRIISKVLCKVAESQEASVWVEEPAQPLSSNAAMATPAAANFMM